MKLPRWLVIAMLTSSVQAVLAAAGWWWVTWPERTALVFVQYVADGRFDDIRNMSRRDQLNGDLCSFVPNHLDVQGS